MKSQIILSHHGIKGMQWGVRRTKRQLSADRQSLNAIRKKRVGEMTNDELKKANERMQLERTYKQLKSQDISKGRKAVGKILQSIGSKVGKEILNQATQVAMQEIMKRKTAAG